MPPGGTHPCPTAIFGKIRIEWASLPHFVGENGVSACANPFGQPHHSRKATWSDDTDLFGFYPPEKKIFISTRFLETIIKAKAKPLKHLKILLEKYKFLDI